MVVAKTTASVRRDIACNTMQCLSSTAKFGVAMCIVFVTLGGAFTYYWAFIRGRRERDTDNQLNDPFHTPMVVNRVQFNLDSPRHHSADPGYQSTVRRPMPAAPAPQAIVSPRIPHGVWMPPPVYSSHFILPGPPPFPPPYASPQEPVFALGQAPVAHPPSPSLTTSAQSTFPPEPPQSTEHRPSGPDYTQVAAQPRQPSPGYASTISDSNTARDRSNTPVGRQAHTEALGRCRSRSSSLGVQSHSQYDEIVASSGVNEPITKSQDHVPKPSTTTNRSIHRRHASETHAQEKQSRIGRPRVQSVGEPRDVTHRAMHDIFRVGDTQIGREHHSKSRSRRCSSRRRPFVALLSGGESFVGRQDQDRDIIGEGHLDQPVAHPSGKELVRARDASMGRQDRGRNTHGSRRRGPPPTSRGRSRGPSPYQSGVSSTGAICSFEGSDTYQASPSPASSSQRYRRTASRSISAERAVSRTRYILSIPESPRTPRPTESEDLYLASVEDNTEEEEEEDNDDNDCHPRLN